MASRRALAEDKDKIVTLPQDPEHAYNPGGWAIKIPDGDWKNQIVVINAKEKSSTHLAAAIKTLSKEGKEIYRESLDFSERERNASPEAGLHRYLVVGFTKSDLDPKVGKLHSKATKGRPVGKVVLGNGIIDIDDSPSKGLLFVVTPVKDEMPGGEASESDSIKLYALIRPERGTCQPVLVKNALCFYLPRFRDAETNFHDRPGCWNRLVLDTCNQIAEVNPSEKQKRFKRARNTTKVVLEQPRDLCNEMSTLIEGLNMNKNATWFVDQMVKTMEYAEEDLEAIPAEDNTYLRKFASEDDVWGDEDSQKLLEELYKTWPVVFGPEDEKVTPERLTLAKEGLSNCKDTVLPYHLLQPFILNVCFQLAEDLKASPTQQGREEATAKVSVILKNTIYCHQGRPQSTVSVQHENTLDEPAAVSMLRSLRDGHRKVHKSSQVFDSLLKRSAGDHVYRGPPQVLSDQLADLGMDTDSAKLVYMDTFKYLASALRHQNRGTTEIVREMTDVLEQLQLD